MSELKLKSSENFKSSDILIKQRLFASSVHCSYYSCIQNMLHILRSDFKKTEEQIDSESKAGSQDESGFHNWIINFFIREFFIRNHRDGREFSNFIGQLKGFRIKSDYKNSKINPTIAKDSLALANQINSILTDNFTT